MTSIDFDRARAFVAAVPRGQWTSYKDVAVAGKSPRGAQAVGQWLRRNGDKITNVYRVLTVDGYVAEGFVAAGPDVPAGEIAVRAVLREEGVQIDQQGCAAASQRFRAEDWSS